MYRVHLRQASLGQPYQEARLLCVSHLSLTIYTPPLPITASHMGLWHGVLPRQPQGRRTACCWSGQEVRRIAGPDGLIWRQQVYILDRVWVTHYTCETRVHGPSAPI